MEILESGSGLIEALLEEAHSITPHVTRELGFSLEKVLAAKFQRARHFASKHLAMIESLDGLSKSLHLGSIESVLDKVNYERDKNKNKKIKEKIENFQYKINK